MKDRIPRQLWRPLQVLTINVCALLAGCGSGGAVGEGVKPSYLVVFPSTDPTQTSETRVYECEEASLKAYLYFTDGSVGDFTNRVKWSSASPGIVAVSDGDTPVPYSTGLYYKKGTMLPAAGGSTFVTADYQGIQTSIRVDVGTPTDLQLTDSDYNALPASVRIGSGTTELLKVTGKIDGILQDLSSFAYWTFDNGGDPGVITVSNGTLNGISAGGQQTLRVKFPTCDSELTEPVSVADIKSISIQREFPDGTQLIVGNTEKFTALADFGDGGTQQDVSTQVTFSATDSDVLSFGTAGIGNIMYALLPGGPIAVSATATFADQSELTSNTLNITSVDGTLESLSVSPEVATITAGSIETAQFTATGTFVLANGNTTTQDITRQVSWTTDDGTLAAISSAPDTAGQASSVSTTKTGQVTVTATDSAAETTPSDTATLTLQ